MTTLAKIGLVGLALYALMVIAMVAVQRRVIYLPDTARVDPGSLGLAHVVEHVLVTPDGARLVMWHAPAKAGRHTFLYLHGNGGGLADRSERIRIMTAEGFGVLVLSWRGYSGSTGSPSEAANVADARLAYDWLLAQGVAPGRLVLFGESLGTGVAVQIAAENRAAGLVLDSPFTSLVDVAAGRFPFLPVRLGLFDRYDSLARIGQVRMPLLVFHGDRDEAVPFELGQRLFDAGNEPKRFVAFRGYGHLVPFSKGSWDAVAEFVRGL